MKKIVQQLSHRAKAFIAIIGFAIIAILSSSYVDAYFDISKNLEIFTSAFRQVNTYYVDEIKPNELAKKGIDAMLKGLDPYTNYISESEIEDYRFMTTGQYGGIGSLIRKKGEYVLISEPYEGYPAQKSGLMAGDVLLEVDGKSVKNKSTDEIGKVLKGQAGTMVTVLIKRNEINQEIKIERAEIKVKAVPYYGMIADGVGYIVLTSFTENCSKEVKDALMDLKEKNHITSLVLDLRNNPGGLLHESINIANLFVEKNQEIVTTKGKVAEWQKSYKALNAAIDTAMPIVVLVNKGSASASEIVSGSLQDLDRAVVLGQRTFGKGLVQTTKNLTYNSKLKVTTAKYYVPSGRCIQALDYSHRNEDGSVGKVPDSLMKPFKTRAGRTVFDGGGIKPDLFIKAKNGNQLIRTLETKLYIFDFAVDYRRSHAQIDSAANFKISEADYNSFLTFIEGKDYAYTSATEKIYSELKDDLKEDQYYSSVEAEYKAMEAKILHHEKDDIVKYKQEIKQTLEREIVAMYYYQRGKIAYALANDNEVKEAKVLLNDKIKYNAILKGTFQDSNKEE